MEGHSLQRCVVAKFGCMPTVIRLTEQRGSTTRRKDAEDLLESVANMSYVTCVLGREREGTLLFSLALRLRAELMTGASDCEAFLIEQLTNL